MADGTQYPSPFLFSPENLQSWLYSRLCFYLHHIYSLLEAKFLLMRNVKKNVVYSAIGYMLPLLAALVTIPIMVKHLGSDLYGLYAICISLVGFMTLVDLGVGQTVVKYVAEYEATEQRYAVKPLLDIAFLIYVVIGFLAASLLFGFSGKLGTFFFENNEQQLLAKSVLQLTAIALFFSYVNQFFVNVCRAYHRFDIPSIMQNVGNLGGIVLASVLLLMGYSIKAIMLGYIVIYSTAFVYGYYASSKVIPAEIRLGFAFDRDVFQVILDFSLYAFISNFLHSLTSRGDKLFIGGIIGAEAVTFYQIPYTIAQMANGIVHTLVQIVFPRFSELVALEEEEKLAALYKTVTQAMMLISGFLAVLLITVGDDFLNLWLSEAFAAKAAITLQIIAVYSFFQANIVVSYWLVQSTGNTKLIAWISLLGATIYFMSVYFLGKTFGYNGAAAALFGLLVPVPIWFIWLQRHLAYRFGEYLWWLSVTILGVLSLIYALNTMNDYLDNPLLAILADGVIAAGLLLGGLWLLFKPSQLTWFVKRHSA